MYRVKGSLSNGKAFAFDSATATLDAALTDTATKLRGKVPAGTDITRVSFQKRGETITDIQIGDAPKRARTPATPAAAAATTSTPTAGRK